MAEMKEALNKLGKKNKQTKKTVDSDIETIKAKANELIEATPTLRFKKSKLIANVTKALPQIDSEKISSVLGGGGSSGKKKKGPRRRKGPRKKVSSTDVQIKSYLLKQKRGDKAEVPTSGGQTKQVTITDSVILQLVRGSTQADIDRVRASMQPQPAPESKGDDSASATTTTKSSDDDDDNVGTAAAAAANSDDDNDDDPAPAPAPATGTGNNNDTPAPAPAPAPATSNSTTTTTTPIIPATPINPTPAPPPATGSKPEIDQLLELLESINQTPTAPAPAPLLSNAPGSGNNNNTTAPAPAPALGVGTGSGSGTSDTTVGDTPAPAPAQAGNNKGSGDLFAAIRGGGNLKPVGQRKLGRKKKKKSTQTKTGPLSIADQLAQGLASMHGESTSSDSGTGYPKLDPDGNVRFLIKSFTEKDLGYITEFDAAKEAAGWSNFSYYKQGAEAVFTLDNGCHWKNWEELDAEEDDDDE